MKKWETILPTQTDLAPKRKRQSKWPLTLLVVTLALFWMVYRFNHVTGLLQGAHTQLPKNDLTCPQTDSLSPEVHRDLAIALENEYASDDFRSRIAELLGGAVQVPYVNTLCHS